MNLIKNKQLLADLKMKWIRKEWFN